MIFAKTTRYIVTDTGEIPVEIRLHQPVETDGHWRCLTEIDWPERTQSMSVPGRGPVDAIDAGVQIIGIHLYTSQYHAEGRLRANWMRGGYGFPLCKGLRDWLVGDDKEMFG